MKNKQTAVGWLEQEFIKLESTTGVYGVMYELIEKAKDIEKEQIEEAYWEGGQDVPVNGKQCEQYYNDTYGKQTNAG